MSDLPTLIVDGDPADYITEDYYEDGTQVVPVRTTVRVDGPLPTVPARKNADGWRLNARPLCAGDRVTLATTCNHRECRSEYSIEHDTEWACNHWQTDGSVPFATATVDTLLASDHPWVAHDITLTDVEVLP